ncbi:MAG: hypothetical protein E7496_07105 [Ruminococcus sp.]|nr:hypothetical protein [Ruminococcus sp.]
MKKILFASDLDNTLIHSHKHKSDSDICVELYQEREQSFMSQEAVTLFQNMTALENICFLPVTTRTIAQYQRIFFPDDYRPEFALTANGHILLRKDAPEPEWLAESQQKNKPYLPEFERLAQIFHQDMRFRHVSIADGMFVACSCETSETADICLAEYQHSTALHAFRTGRKLYFFQPCADKGTALAKFKSLHQFDVIISAGDSEMDIPMLKQADISLFRETQTDFAVSVLTLVLDTALS